jgi:hypothetical protein
VEVSGQFHAVTVLSLWYSASKTLNTEIHSTQDIKAHSYKIQELKENENEISMLTRLG